jgi:hypothetical protein
MRDDVHLQALLMIVMPSGHPHVQRLIDFFNATPSIRFHTSSLPFADELWYTCCTTTKAVYQGMSLFRYGLLLFLYAGRKQVKPRRLYAALLLAPPLDCDCLSPGLLLQGTQRGPVELLPSLLARDQDGFRPPQPHPPPRP